MRFQKWLKPNGSHRKTFKLAKVSCKIFTSKKLQKKSLQSTAITKNILLDVKELVEKIEYNDDYRLYVIYE